MSSGYFNFDFELGHTGEQYVVHCFNNLIQDDSYYKKGTEVLIPVNIDDNKFYCFKRFKGVSIAVKGYHLKGVSNVINRNKLPFESIIEVCNGRINNLSEITKANLYDLLRVSPIDIEHLNKYHSSYIDKSKYDFTLDFIGKKFKVEVKTDAMSLKTGNLFIEFEQNMYSDWSTNWDSNSVPSGMKISESDIWAYLLSPEVIIFIKPTVLDRLYEKRHVGPLRVVYGGNRTPNEKNPRTKGILIPIHYLLNMDLNLSKDNNFSLAKIHEYSLS